MGAQKGKKAKSSLSVERSQGIEPGMESAKRYNTSRLFRYLKVNQITHPKGKGGGFCGGRREKGAEGLLFCTTCFAKLYESKPGFLNLSTADIGAKIMVCIGRCFGTVGCFISIPGPNLPGTSSKCTTPTTNTGCDNQKVSGHFQMFARGKLTSLSH